MKVLVTGCAGFIGSHVTEALLKRGDDVIGVDNYDPFYPRAIKERNIDEIASTAESAGAGKFIFLEKDINNYLDPSLEEHGMPDVILHLAAKAGVRPSIEDPIGYQIANVVGTTNMLELAVRYGIKRFVFASSSSVYGEGAANGLELQEWDNQVTDAPASPYAASKRSCELIGKTFSRLHGIRFTALRYFTVYGPRQRPEMAIHKFLRKALRHEEIRLFGDPRITERDYTYISDIVDGTIAAVDQKDPMAYRVFNLGGGYPVTLGYLMGIIETITEQELNINLTERQPGDVLRTISDIRRARMELDYDPQIPIERGIELFLSWIEDMKEDGRYVEEEL